MQITLQGYIIARKHDWDDEPRFTWLGYDPTDMDKTAAIVRPHEISFMVEDGFDIRPCQIATLRRQKAVIQARAAEDAAKIDAMIQTLLALPER